MAAETSKDLVLYFERSDGKSYSLSIPDYLADITDEQIKTGAQGILAEGIFEPEGFALVKATNAVKIETTKTDVPLETE
ncbi:DUF2922 domain-containing protein [Eubacterium sp. 1001713B170207_170306_E7]|uniref:DUF2922 domain-containing protein n=1 Tax=Eubacterium sp. 1001713B170207_170306_E7 TaxID=2787097 RepID=UPI00189C2A32|nr:DUF2922 domain-containing protein [Eubacterium sp. 1001713B170207_170306_E7]